MKRTKRDLTQEQFEYRVTKLGFKKEGFMGYWRLASNPSVMVSVWNAGKRRRDQLKYLVREDKRERYKTTPFTASEKQASTQAPSPRVP